MCRSIHDSTPFLQFRRGPHNSADDEKSALQMTPAMPGYSGTPLAKKLGVKDDTRLMAVHAPPGYASWLGTLPSGATFVSRAGPSVDIEVCAVTDVWSGLKLVVRKERR
jgi:hypothetical protein